MDSSSIPNDLGLRLERLTREVHSSLAQVRQRIHELREAEQSADSRRSVVDSDFARLLRQSLDENGTP